VGHALPSTKLQTLILSVVLVGTILQAVIQSVLNAVARLMSVTLDRHSATR